MRLQVSQAGPIAQHSRAGLSGAPRDVVTAAYLDEAVVDGHGVESMVLAGRRARSGAVPLPTLAAGSQALDRFTSMTTRAQFLPTAR